MFLETKNVSEPMGQVNAYWKSGFGKWSRVQSRQATPCALLGWCWRKKIFLNTCFSKFLYFNLSTQCWWNQCYYTVSNSWSSTLKKGYRRIGKHNEKKGLKIYWSWGKMRISQSLQHTHALSWKLYFKKDKLPDPIKGCLRKTQWTGTCGSIRLGRFHSPF